MSFGVKITPGRLRHGRRLLERIVRNYEAERTRRTDQPNVQLLWEGDGLFGGYFDPVGTRLMSDKDATAGGGKKNVRRD